VTILSDDRNGELRNLFFESADELLQNLNEEGLKLETRPDDPEIIREVRRTIHTLKGDSAACGFRELSELAHEFEDVLTAENVVGQNGSLAQVILTAADTFHAMLAAYRGDLRPPDGNQLRDRIRELAQSDATTSAPALAEARFAWSEYEHMLIAAATERGDIVYNVAMRLDNACPMRAAAQQLARNVLHEAGTILVLQPDDTTAHPEIDLIEAALASRHEREWVLTKCRIPGVVAEVIVEVEAMPQHAELPAAPAASAMESPAHVEQRESGTVPAVAAHAASETSLRVDAARIDAVLNLVGELMIGKSVLQQTVNDFERRFPRDPLRGRFADVLALQSRVLNDLQKSVMKVRMVPVEQLYRRMPRIVRDVSKLRGKDVALAITGQETDLDKSVVDALAEPLVHLVRNAVDHGIEPPEERVAAGKSARGTVRLDAYHQGNQVVIEISDDGRGINREKVLAKAVERGIITAEEISRLTEQEALNLIFHPGLSTSDQVTEVSGRGVGMDVVKSAIGKLKGTVSVETNRQNGTTFRLKLPLTLAIIKALLFHVGERLYAVSLSSVLEITRACEEDIHRVDGHSVMQLRNETLTLVWLDRMAPEHAAQRSERFFVVVIGFADRKFGLVVDRLVGEEELVIKPLDDQMVSTDLLSGASILGDGKVALILNLPAVIARFAKAVEETAEVLA
jgi:two-component system, chemotaxis family, sensor kinase CheA